MRVIRSIMLFSIFIISLLFFIINVYSAPYIANESKTIDIGNFDINYVDDNVLIYSKKVNSSDLFSRAIFYEYDFKSGEKKSFNRFTKNSQFIQGDNNSILIVEPIQSNVRNYSLVNYRIFIHYMDLDTRKREVLKIIDLVNLTNSYFKISKGERGNYLFELLTDEFVEFNNDTDRYEATGEVLNYYIIKNKDVLKVDKITYNEFKKKNYLFENSKYSVKENFVLDKINDVVYEGDFNQNQICGVSENYLYYVKKLYYETAKNPIYILVKHDYINNIEQDIIVDDYKCFTGDLSFYIRPYLFSMKDDKFNILTTDKNQIQVLNEKIIFTDGGLDVIYIGLDDTEQLELNFTEDDNLIYLTDNSSNNYNLNINSSKELNNQKTQIKNLTIPKLDDRNVISKNDKFDLDKYIYKINDEGDKELIFEEYLTVRNIIVMIIMAEFLIVLIILKMFIFPKRNNEITNLNNNLEIVKKEEIIAKNNLNYFKFRLPKFNLKPKIKFNIDIKSKIERSKNKISIEPNRVRKLNKISVSSIKDYKQEKYYEKYKK